MTATLMLSPREPHAISGRKDVALNGAHASPAALNGVHANGAHTDGGGTAEAAGFMCAGEYLGRRLVELGLHQVYTVPGDFNLTTLDALRLAPGLALINTANELNAAYAADGQSRAVGLGALVTTFNVGSLSALNGVAGSFAEDLPIVCVVGCPSTEEYAVASRLHHTLGNAQDMTQQAECYRPVVCYHAIIRNMMSARYLIDKALTHALTERKPVLIEVHRDMPLVPHPTFGARAQALRPLRAAPPDFGDSRALADAVACITTWLEGKQRPLVLVGREARWFQPQLRAFVDASRFATASLHEAKGFFCDHPCHIGTYFKAFSDPAAILDTYQAADALLVLGASFDEFSWGHLPTEEEAQRAVIVFKGMVAIGMGEVLTSVAPDALLAALAKSVKPNPGALHHFRSLPQHPPSFPVDPEFSVDGREVPLKLEYVYEVLQRRLLDDTRTRWSLIAETGDTLWRTHKLRMQRGSTYEVQLQWGSIGWATPAGLGYSLAMASGGGALGEGRGEGGADARPGRTLVISGDGALQMTVQELGAYTRFGSNAVYLLVNNDGYLVERYISVDANADYNYTKRWKYAALAEAMCAGEGSYRVLQAATPAEVDAAFDLVDQLPDSFIFVEVVVSKHDACPGAGAMRSYFVEKQLTHLSSRYAGAKPV